MQSLRVLLFLLSKELGTVEKKICLLLHGYTGGPFEVAPAARYLTEQGWSCRVPTLPGHGEGGEGLRTVGWEDWLRSAEKEAEVCSAKGGSFDLVGFSMGGMIALHLASRYPVRRLVLLNAAAIYISPARFLSETVGRWRRKVAGPRHKIRQTPLRSALEFVKLVHSVRPAIGRVKVPTLVVQGLRDPIVHPASAAYIANRLAGARELRYFPRSRHLICLDEESEGVVRAIHDFLDR